MSKLYQFPPLTDPALQKYDLKNKVYKGSDCVVLCKVKQPFGDLLNMSSRFPLSVNGENIRSIEALYQSMRFPSVAVLQKKIIDEPSPYNAKQLTKDYKEKVPSRPDWYQNKVLIMRWCLQQKLACHYDEVGKLLDETGDKDIVETSPDGHFWGGNKYRDSYEGANVFGQLLMELRQELRTKTEAEIKNVGILAMNDFLLLGNPITLVETGVVPVKAKKKTAKKTKAIVPDQLNLEF